MAKSSSVDLSKFTIPELQELAEEIESEIVTRRESAKMKVLEQMRELGRGDQVCLHDVSELHASCRSSPRATSPEDERTMFMRWRDGQVRRAPGAHPSP